MIAAFIQLSLDSGLSVHINVNHIAQFSPKEKNSLGCNITINNMTFGVQQTYGEIVSKLQSLEK